MDSPKMLKLSQAARGLTALCSAAATVLFGVIASRQYEAATNGKAVGWSWNCLPLVGVRSALHLLMQKQPF